MKFEHLTTRDGLSQAGANAIIQDKKGFLWFGTQKGANRYNGYDFRVFLHNEEDPGSISNDVINCFYEDQSGDLWIGTYGGLNRFNQKTQRFISYKNDPVDTASISNNIVFSILEDRQRTLWVGTNSGLNKYDSEHAGFIRFRHDPNNLDSISSDFITCVYEDRSGGLWIGTNGGGLNKYDPENDRFVHFRYDANNHDSISSDFITSIYEDRTKTLYIGTKHTGLNVFDRENGRFIHYHNQADKPDSISSNDVTSMVEDQSGSLFIGTTNGLNEFDRANQNFIHFQHDPGDPGSLNANHIISLYSDRAGLLWVGVFGGKGVNKFDPKKEKFTTYRHNPNDPDSFAGNMFFSVVEDEQPGIFWVGSFAGLDKFDRKNKRVIRHYQHDPENPNSLSDNKIFEIYKDRSGMLWISTAGGGLNRFDPKTQRFTRYQHDPDNPDSLASNVVWPIMEDRSGMLWIGTFNNAGLERFDRKNNTFTHYKHNPNDPGSLSNDKIFEIYEDKHGTLWIGTYDGLNRFDRENNQFIRFKNDPHDPESISNNVIKIIHEDYAGNLWIGTFGGLNKFDRKTQTFTRYTEKNGLPAGTFFGLAEDDHKNFWLGTNKGLVKFNIETRASKLYDVRDGIQDSEFNTAALKSRNGEIFMGGVNGLNIFEPEDIKDNRYIPPVVITDFQLFNRPVEIGEDSVLKESIEGTKEITLSHQDKKFSFEFLALNYTNSEKNRYAYMMEGFDENWTYRDSKRRFATYTNLSPGSYTFRVKGSNNDGIWNEKGASVKINILPPPWRTWWAYCIYVLIPIFAFLGYGFSQGRKRHQLERLVERRTKELRIAKEKAELAAKVKSEFLANMSHELRTPLNAVTGFSELLISIVTDDKQKSYLSAIKTAGRSLLTLINDILDLSKIEAGRIELNKSSVSLKSLFDEMAQIFQMKIMEKNLEFIIEIDRDVPESLFLDETRVRQVLLNLIGNAVKFTDNGHIRLSAKVTSVKQDTLDLIISVEDTGIGIAEDEQKTVFNVFTQQSGQKTEKYGGTGLGLSITKKLTELMNGQIEVKSAKDSGSIFSITLKAVEISSRHVSVVEASNNTMDDIRFKKANVLIVDDVESNRILLSEMLKKLHLDCTTAKNGEEGLFLARQMSPDLIIMDIRMPVMDGYDANQKLKQSPETREIPVIALTASVTLEEKSRVLENEFNSFLTKPIKVEHLIGELSKLLEFTTIDEKSKTGNLSFISLDIDGYKQSEGLIRKLKSEILPLFETNKKVMIMENIGKFAEKLMDTGKAHNAENLIDYAMELQNDIKSFDVAAIQKKFQNFSDEIESLILKLRK